MHLFAFSVDLISYLTRFEWDMAKYPIKQPLKNISEALAKVNFTPVFKKLSAWASMSFGSFWSLLSGQSVRALPLVWAGTGSEACTEAVDIIVIYNVIIMVHIFTPIWSVSIWHFMRFTRVHWHTFCTLIPSTVTFYCFYLLPCYSPFWSSFVRLLAWH